MTLVTHRARPPLTLAWNPLAFVLGQVVTSAVLQITDYIPELQEQLRRNGYPNFNQVEMQNVKLGPKGAMDVARESRWVFLNKDATKSVVVSSSFVVLESAIYESFDEFVDDLHEVVTLFHRVVDVELCQRLGLRRINLLEHSERLPLDDILEEGLRGLTGDVFAEGHEQRVEHWGNTRLGGRLMVRLLRPAPRTVVAPDLEVTGLDIRTPRTDGWDSATLDIDHFLIGQQEFSPESIVEGFWSLHDASDLAFREAVTTKALEAWEKGDPYDD